MNSSSRNLFFLLCMAGATACGPESAAPQDGENQALGHSQQSLSAPVQDPQQCNLQEGRYVVAAKPTTHANVYDVFFFNDTFYSPSAGCKSMLFVWTEGTNPVPPTPPNQSEFGIRLFEGWFGPNAQGQRRFAVKAVWRTQYRVSVFPTNLHARIYNPGDVSDMGGTFNVMDPFTGSSHISWEYITVPGQEYGSIFLTPYSSNSVVQSLYLESGTSRLTGSEQVRNYDGTCPTGYTCAPLPPNW
ncbi:hypothetical protein F0U60_02610 [Archangium minus]|uniref:Lipoprotein n=1 Tax=Archangium minus TaxID=83450 RepID=A0ABY9WKZ9_9BACT|nr:hypothetical protein F0U60_02610 [Archangium minus]